MTKEQIEQLMGTEGMKGLEKFLQTLFRRPDVRALPEGKYPLEVIFLDDSNGQHWVVEGNVLRLSVGIMNGLLFEFTKMKAVPKWEAEIIENTYDPNTLIEGCIKRFK